MSRDCVFTLLGNKTAQTRAYIHTCITQAALVVIAIIGVVNHASPVEQGWASIMLAVAPRFFENIT